MRDPGWHSVRRHGLLVVAAAAAVAGCRPSAEADGSVDKDTVAGRPVVKNSAAPAAEGELTQLWEQRLASSFGTIEAWEPEPEVRVAGDRLAVSNPVSDRVQLRRVSDGGLDSRIGGSGSAEEGRIDSLHALAASDTLVAVADRDSIEVFGLDGGRVDRLAVSGRILDLYGSGEAEFIARAFTGSSTAWMRYAPLNAPRAEPLPPMAAGSSTLKEARARSCWQTDGGAASMLLVNCTYAVILEMGYGGAVSREITVDLPPVRSSAEELDAVRRQVGLQMEQAGREPAPEIRKAILDREARRHELKKRFRAVRRDPATGRFAVLEQTPDFMGGGPATVHLFGADGVYLAELRVDDSWIDFDFEDGRLYVLRHGPSDGGVELAAYRSTVNRQ